MIGLAAEESAEKEVSADEREAVAVIILTAEQQASLAAVDVRLAAVEALAAKIEDPDYRAEVARQIEDLKERRLALEKNFDPALHETLMHSVISRYQVVALWLEPPALSPPSPAALEPIRNIEINKSRGLCVNDKPFFLPRSWGGRDERFPLTRCRRFDRSRRGRLQNTATRPRSGWRPGAVRL